jgi:hypothetical protein
LVVANQSNKAADKRAAAATQAGAYSQNLLADIAGEEWDLYKTEAIPLLRQLAGMRSPTTVEQEQAMAAGETKGAYGQARQQLERAIGRTRNPGDQGFAALMAPTYIDEAGAVSRAITDARTRVNDRDWARTLQTIQGYQRLPQDASAAASQSGALANATQRNVMQAGQIANQNAAQAAYGTVAIANSARRWFNPPQSGGGDSPGGDPYNYGDNYYSSDLYGEGYTSSEDYGAQMSDTYLKHGGRIRGPGTGTSDSVPALVDGRKPIRVSSGEYVVPADVVKQKGQEFFDKLLQKYHRPAPERSRDGMADGGVLRRRGLPADVEDAIFVSLPREALSSRRGR